MGMLLCRHYADNKGAAEEKAAPVSSETKPEEVKAQITAEEIKAMNGTKLRKLAKDMGVENPEDYTVSELKAVLCEKVD